LLSDVEDDDSGRLTFLTNNSDEILVTNADYSFSNLSSYDALLNFHHNDGSYSDPEIITLSIFDQSQSERYDYGFKDSTNTVALSGQNIIDSLLYEEGYESGNTEYWYSGEPNIISYSFFNKDLLLLDELDYTYYASGLSWDVYHNDFYSFTDEQKASVRLALAEFSEVINVEFVEVIEELDQVGTLRFGISHSDFDDSAAFAIPPGEYWSSNGDIWFSNTFANESLLPGTWEFHVLLHEIGHAMGLSHPHEGGAQILVDQLDFINFTVMSYEDPDWAFFDSGLESYFTISESLMVYDILALQHIYGANLSYNLGNTSYTWDENTPTSVTIWDAGGEDILDFSNFNLSSEINLNDGTYSTIDFPNWQPENNFGIAFNTFIENVSGTQADDYILGNELDNEILGNGGNDILIGGPGDDIFDWKADSRGGSDTMYGGPGNDIFVLGLYGGTDKVIEYYDEGYDLVYVESNREFTLPENVEEVRGIGSRPLELRGNGSDNVLRGGSGNDILYGGGGADDFLLYLDMGNDVVYDFDVLSGDEVVLAHGLDSIDFEILQTIDGVLFQLSDGSSLLLNGEVIV
jgi:serralysin